MVRPGSAHVPPPFGWPHLTSTARAWGLPVTAERASLHLGGQRWPQIQWLLIQLVQVALGLGWGMVSGGEGTGQGQDLTGNSFLGPWDLDPSPESTQSPLPFL